MRNNLLKIGFGVMLGIFLALLFRCEPKCPEVETKIEYIDRKVEVPIDRIVYEKGEEVPVYIPVPGEDGSVDTVYLTLPGDSTPVVPTTRYTRPFAYSDTAISITGEANILADKLYDFKFNALDVKYTERVITNTIETPRRMNLLVGSNLMFSPNNFNGVNFNVGLKTKKDFVFEVGYNANFTGTDSYEAGFKIPVFHKK